MKFADAFREMRSGNKVKLPTWGGYWYWDTEKETIIMHLRTGDEVDIRESTIMSYTMENICSEEWLIADEENCPELGGTEAFGFGAALKYLAKGYRLARKGWNGKGLSVVYQKGYPDGIPCNKQTAEAWGLHEGDLFKCEPYLQISTVDGSHAMWVPSIRDCLAEDWYFVDR